MRCVITVHPYPFEPEDSVFVEAIRFALVRKDMCRRFTFLSRLAQRQARDGKQETEERNIQQRSIHHRNRSDHVEPTDQHHAVRQNDHVYADSSD